MTVFIIGLSGCSTTKYNVSVPDNLDPKFKQLVHERVIESKKVQDVKVIDKIIEKPVTVTNSFITPKQRVNVKTILEQKKATTKTNKLPELKPKKEPVVESEVIIKDTVELQTKYNTIFLVSVIQSLGVIVLGIYLFRKNKL